MFAVFALELEQNEQTRFAEPSTSTTFFAVLASYTVTD